MRSNSRTRRQRHSSGNGRPGPQARGVNSARHRHRIEPDLLPRLYDAFSQADHSLERSRGGLGLGLALVKGLIELHGGQVDVSSAGVGRGAEFTVFLPLQDELAALTSIPAQPLRARKRLRVLIVETAGTLPTRCVCFCSYTAMKSTWLFSGPEGVKTASESNPPCHGYRPAGRSARATRVIQPQARVPLRCLMAGATTTPAVPGEADSRICHSCRLHAFRARKATLTSWPYKLQKQTQRVGSVPAVFHDQDTQSFAARSGCAVSKSAQQARLAAAEKR